MSFALRTRGSLRKDKAPEHVPEPAQPAPFPSEDLHSIEKSPEEPEPRRGTRRRPLPFAPPPPPAAAAAAAATVVEQQEGDHRAKEDQDKPRRSRSLGIESSSSPVKRRKITPTEEHTNTSKSVSSPTSTAAPSHRFRSLPKKAAVESPAEKKEAQFNIFDDPFEDFIKVSRRGRKFSPTDEKGKETEKMEDNEDKSEDNKEHLALEEEELADYHDEEDHPAEMDLDPAAQTLQTLLNKLGVGMEMLHGQGSSPAKLKIIIEGLKAVGEDDRQYLSLQELNDYLSMGTEETMGGFSVDQFIPPIMQLLNMEYNPDMMLLACRAIANMTEALPNSVGSIVGSGVIPVICSKLMSVEYIDLAEQALTTLEKLSFDHPGPILRAGGLVAVLSFLDFFPMGVQRSAVTTASNLCRSVPQDCFHLTIDAIPILTNLLRYQDHKVIEKACLSFSRLIDSFARNQVHLKSIASQGMLANMVYLISPANSVPVSSGTFTMIVKLLSVLCRSCPSLANDLLENTDIVTILRDVLSGAPLPPSESKDDLILGSPSHMTRPSEQLAELLSLCAELLPPLPRSEIFALQGLAASSSSPSSSANPLVSSSSSSSLKSRPSPKPRKKDKNGGEASPSDEKSRSSATSRGEEAEAQADPRIKFLTEHNHVMVKLSTVLLPVLVDVFSTTVSPAVRQNCLNAIVKVIFYSPAETLESALRDLTISSFVAGLLAARDYNIVVGGFQICDDLMKKLPAIFKIYFKKEGVVHELRRLAALPQGAQTPSSPATPASTPANPAAAAPAQPVSSSSTPGRDTTRKLADIMRKFRDRSGGAGEQPDPSPTTPRNQRAGQQASSSSEDLKNWVIQQSQTFCATYFPEGGESSSSPDTSPTVKKLKDLGAVLADPASSAESSFRALAGLSKLFSDQAEGVSAFELMNCEIIPRLNIFLTSSNGTVPRRQRLMMFFRVFLDGPRTEVEDVVKDYPHSASNVALSFLIKRLHESFTKLEQLPILLHEVIGGDVRGNLSGLKVLTQPFKLRLQKMESDTSALKDYGENVVMIEPLASMQAIENFLLAKVTDSSQQGQKSKGKPDAPAVEDPSLFRKRTTSSKPRNDSEVQDIALPAEDSGLDVVSKEASAESLNAASSSSTASASSSSSQDSSSPKLDFFVGENQLPPNMTIFQAVEKFCRGGSGAPGGEGAPLSAPPAKFMWSSVYTIKYRSHVESGSQSSKKKGPDGDRFYTTSDLNFHLDTPFQLGVVKEKALGDVLSLLKTLHVLNQFWTSLFPGGRLAIMSLNVLEFVNSKLNAKLTRQLQDPLALCSSSLPDWCEDLALAMPFLFFFETRYSLLYSTSFGIARALMRLQERSQEQQQQHDSSSEAFKMGRIQRQKVRINRKKLFESALKVMEQFSASKAVLEVEYFDEVGTGLGPTLEFYTSTSKEFRKKSLGIWRDVGTPENDEFVHSPHGLFPKPMTILALSSDKGRKVLYLFKILGMFVAKALLDFRTIDIPFSPVFLKWMLGQESSLTIRDVADIDPVIGKSLSDLKVVAEERKVILENPALSQAEKEKKVSEIRLAGAEIHDLLMDFTLPGYPNMELRPNGGGIPVSLTNVGDFVELAVRTTLVTGVAEQLRAFRQGFSSVFPIEDLQLFSPQELDVLINGSEEAWDVETLNESIKADHGYANDSPAIRRLMEVLSEFKPAEQREFLKFITGSPRLPVGGLKALNPKLTVVRKTPEYGNPSDSYLPSAMTCANYLKLPDYSSKDVMVQKLKIAMTEGQGSFHLS